MADETSENAITGSRVPDPTVSIVVPCFNGGRFLDSLMDSLARQTYRDFELIIVDDGSTDDLTIRKLKTLEDRARIIRQKNSGASAARNTGIRHARADIVFTLDSDDMVEPTFLAETVPLLRNAPPDVGMVVSHLRLVGAESGVVPRYFHRFDLLFTNTLSTGLVLRKACWRAVGGYDETMRDGYEDWDFSLRLARAGFRGLEIPKPLYVYHVATDDQASSISSSVHARRLYARLWRQIRHRHAPSYRPWNMARLWFATRDGGGRVSLIKGFTGYFLALVLPDAVFNQMIASLHRRRMPAQHSAANT